MGTPTLPLPLFSLLLLRLLLLGWLPPLLPLLGWQSKQVKASPDRHTQTHTRVAQDADCRGHRSRSKTRESGQKET